jgi:hypothetical protein
MEWRLSYLQPSLAGIFLDSVTHSKNTKRFGCHMNQPLARFCIFRFLWPFLRQPRGQRAPLYLRHNIAQAASLTAARPCPNRLIVNPVYAAQPKGEHNLH